MAAHPPPARGLDALRQRLLDAREARQAAIDRQRGAGHSVILVGTNIPGPEKYPPGVERLVEAGRLAVERALSARRVDGGRDALGPWVLLTTLLEASTAKRATIDLEDTVPGGRLLDLDVWPPDGGPTGRAGLGIGPRSCLVCSRPAAECIRLQRHPAADVEAAGVRLLPAGP
jgi:holo-ACP synthase CitX